MVSSCWAGWKGIRLRGNDAWHPVTLPINVIYPHSRLQSAKVRAFVDACVAALRPARFD